MVLQSRNAQSEQEDRSLRTGMTIRVCQPGRDRSGEVPEQVCISLHGLLPFGTTSVQTIRAVVASFGKHHLSLQLPRISQLLVIEAGNTAVSVPSVSARMAKPEGHPHRLCPQISFLLHRCTSGATDHSAVRPKTANRCRLVEARGSRVLFCAESEPGQSDRKKAGADGQYCSCIGHRQVPS